MSDLALGNSRALAQTAQELSHKQRAALESLRAGSGFPQAAEQAGVGRATVYRWVQSDPHFRAAYNAWQQELVESKAGLSPAEQRRYLRDHGLAAVRQQLAGAGRKALAGPEDETNGPAGAGPPASITPEKPPAPADKPLSEQQMPMPPPTASASAGGETSGEIQQTPSHDGSGAANP